MNISRRRALLDLLGEGRACSIGDAGFLAGLLLPPPIDGIERVLEAGGREHDDVAVLRPGRRLKWPPGEQHSGGESERPANPFASVGVHHASPIPTAQAVRAGVELNTILRYIPLDITSGTNCCQAGRRRHA